MTVEDFPGISECFDHTPTNLITVLGSNVISVKESISSLVNRRYGVVYFPEHTPVYMYGLLSKFVR